MKVEKQIDSVESEPVARRPEVNREFTQIDANLWERDRLGRCGVRLAPRFGRKGKTGDVVGETPTTAVERSEQHKSVPLRGLTALPMNRIAEYSRLLASIRGSMRNSLISMIVSDSSL